MITKDFLKKFISEGKFIVDCDIKNINGEYIRLYEFINKVNFARDCSPNEAQGFIDLFEHPEELPEEMKDLVTGNHSVQFEDNYEACEKMLKLMRPLGYVFEYGLDAEPYDLRKIETFYPDNIQKLNSVGGGFDPDNGNTYAQNRDGSYDPGSEVHISNVVPEWYDELSTSNKREVDALMKKFDVDPKKLSDNYGRSAIITTKSN